LLWVSGDYPIAPLTLPPLNLGGCAAAAAAFSAAAAAAVAVALSIRSSCRSAAALHCTVSSICVELLRLTVEILRASFCNVPTAFGGFSKLFNCLWLLW